MTYEQLMDFLQNRMRMSHIYQPLLIRTLLDAGGSATVRQIAQAFLLQDESQTLYYENRIKEMPVPVLKRHHVLQCAGNLVSLDIPKITLQQKASIRLLCEQKMQEYIVKKGLSIWDYRMLETEPVPDLMRLHLLKASGGRCAACGATKNERPLHIDHIKPRSKGGTNALENLQVLCDRCNLAKSNKVEIDFRSSEETEFVPNCPFCSPQIQAGSLEEYSSVFAIYAPGAVLKNHLLVIPKKHRNDFFAMTETERHDAHQILRILKARVLEEDSSIMGFQITAECGEAAGLIIPHAHVHMIPRRRTKAKGEGPMDVSPAGPGEIRSNYKQSD